MSGLVAACEFSDVSPSAGVAALAAVYGMERPISLRALLSTVGLYADRSLARSYRVIRFSAQSGVRALAKQYGISGQISLRKVLDDVWTTFSLSKIKRFFVLVLENRSFDHLLGFSGITAVDSQTGVERAIDGLTGTESNVDSDGKSHTVSQPGWLRFPWDPNHDHPNVMTQICGSNTDCDSPTMSGFVRDFETVTGGSGNPRAKQPGDIMTCMSPDQLPILIKLASEFAVVDRFHCSLPGPTWPNRFFIHAATSGGYDYDPSIGNKMWHMTVDGYDFTNGNIFERLDGKDIAWAVYSDAAFPSVWAMADVGVSDMYEIYPDFALNLQDQVPVYGDGTTSPVVKFEYQYIFLEGDNDMPAGSDPDDMHPPGHLWSAERLVKDLYEAIRGSAYWEESALIITFDEHGGFFDHVPPPAAVPPGDKPIDVDPDDEYPFDYKRFGVRVPAIVISPWVPRNTVIGGPRAADLYDHTSILATLETHFDLKTLTDRDAAAQNFKHAFRLVAARSDAPATLPDIPDFDEDQSIDPAGSGSPGSHAKSASHSFDAYRSHSTADLRSLPSNLRRYLTAAGMTELKRTPDADRPAVAARLDAAPTVGALLDELASLGQRPPRRRTREERRAVRDAYRKSKG